MAEVRAEVFVDERGNGLRASRHDADGVIVLSIWRGDVCVATARLSMDDASRLSTFLVDSWVAALRQSLSA